MLQKNVLNQAPLGKKSPYIAHYQADLLFPISRASQRAEIGVYNVLPFQGKDIWNAFELSWLNAKGKPIVAAAEFRFACESPNLIESKSFKLYLNSFNNTHFDSPADVLRVLKADLTAQSGAAVAVKLMALDQVSEKICLNFSGTCLDKLDIACDTYTLQRNYLNTENEIVSETVYSDLLKSNCLVTGQPDWASVQISYSGKKINHEGLLKYIVSFRNHNEFHEQCAERIFVDIATLCKPEKLLVYTRYTRRGGLDINSYRSNFPVELENTRLWRQ